MTSKQDFSDAEWNLLLDVPPAVGTAVMYAGRSGLGSVSEAMALASGILNARHGYEGVELIESLVEARIKNGEKSDIETLKSPYRGLSNEEILDDAVEKCAAAGDLLRAKTTAEEADAYATWAITVAEKVANAAKEGGFLGIGGERVSKEEANAIKRIKNALAS